MAFVERLERGDEIGVVVFAGGLVMANRLADRVGHLADQAPRLVDELRDARRGAGEHQTDDALGRAQHVFDGEPAAPGLAEDMDPVQAECGANGIDLANEALDAPERRIVGLVRSPATQLVIEDHRAPLGQAGERFEIVVAGPGPAVQQKQRHAALADAPVPDPVAVDVDPAFFVLHAAPPADSQPNHTLAARPALGVCRRGPCRVGCGDPGGMAAWPTN